MTPASSPFLKNLRVILCGFISVFTFIALYTFNRGDNSPFSVSFPPPPTTINECGLVGSYFAAYAIYWLGCASLLLPAIFLLPLLRSADHSRSFTKISTYLSIATILATASYLAETHLLKVKLSTTLISSGGSGGLLFVEIFNYFFGKTGGYFLVLALSFIATAQLFPLNIPTFRFYRRKKAIKPTKIKKAKAIKKSLVQNESTHLPKLNTPIFLTSSCTEQKTSSTKSFITKTSRSICQTLSEFGIHGTVIGATSGPSVTIFEYLPESGIKLSKVQALIEDLALALKVDSLFIEPIPSKKALGIQVPNDNRKQVLLGDVIETISSKDMTKNLEITIGQTIMGSMLSIDLCAMPHLLIAGATGSGKSVAINVIICNLLYRHGPERVKAIFIDPKMLELSLYEGIPHLICPVVTCPQKASSVLKWTIDEMERRYKIMQESKVRGIEGYNNLMASTGQEDEALPFLVIVIDELADLMMTCGRDIEVSIQRLAQKSRACGIHMIVATQRPSVDVITGVIKANLPARMAFQVASKHDSRTILDQVGAERLLGKGDMLFMQPGSLKPTRVQCSLISDSEINHFVGVLKQRYPHFSYNKQIIAAIDQVVSGGFSDDSDDDDPKFEDAIEIARSNGAISASFLQRQLKIGYNRASRIVERMESKGMVTPSDGVKPRKWLEV